MGLSPLTLPSPLRGEGETSGEPVEIAAAGGAGEERALGAQLLEPLGRHRHAAAAAEVGLHHLGEGEAAARLEELVVVGEHGDGELPRQLRALRAHEGQVGLDGAELFLQRHSASLMSAVSRSWLSMRTRISSSTRPFSCLISSISARTAEYSLLVFTS